MDAEEKIKQANDICCHVNAMIDKTLGLLADIYKKRQEGINNNEKITPLSNNKEEEHCRLIYPCYSNETCRISEQELRFAFLEVFIQYRKDNSEVKDWLYSVETPTMQRYRFSKSAKNIYPKIDSQGQSANFDFVIHDNKLKRICLIEFKALNSNWHEHHKDFFKLIKDHITENNNNALDPYHPYTQRYFIEVLASYDNGTCQNLASKKINLKDDKIELEETERKVGKEIASNIINYTDSVQESNIQKIRFCCFSLKLKQDKKDKDAQKGNITNKIIPPSK